MPSTETTSPPMSNMRGPDIAEVLSSLTPVEAQRMLGALPFDLAVQVLDEPEMRHRHAVFETMPQATAIAFIEAMSADRQADLFRELPIKDASRLLPGLSHETEKNISLLLKYPPDTAAGIMTTEFVSVPTDWTVARTLRHVSDVARQMETIYAIYLTDPGTKRLVQALSLQDLLIADGNLPVTAARAARAPISVPALASNEDAARIISKYNLLAIPVLDEGGTILGIVTVDDVIDTLVRELTEDAQKFGGMEALDAPYMAMGFGAMVKKRAGWLCALFLGEMLTATAMGFFEGEISKAVVLALFIPLIISSGGNSGSQATSLIIRAMALREVALKDWWRIALRELPAGVTLGTILGVIGVLRILLWQKLGWYNYGEHYPLVALTVGTALVGVVTFGSLAGSMLPFILRRVGVDPASASAPFVATLVDVTGLVIFFSVAFVILHGTLL